MPRISSKNPGRTFEVVTQQLGNWHRGDRFTEFEFWRQYPPEPAHDGLDPIDAANAYYAQILNGHLNRQPPAIRVVLESVENPIERDEIRQNPSLSPDQKQLSLIASDSRILLDYLTGFGNRSKQDAEASIDRLFDIVGGSSWPWKGWPPQDSSQLQPALLAVSGLVKTFKDPRWNQAVPKEAWGPVVGALNIIDRFAVSGPSGSPPWHRLAQQSPVKGIATSPGNPSQDRPTIMTQYRLHPNEKALLIKIVKIHKEAMKHHSKLFWNAYEQKMMFTHFQSVTAEKELVFALKVKGWVEIEENENPPSGYLSGTAKAHLAVMRQFGLQKDDITPKEFAVLEAAWTSCNGDTNQSFYAETVAENAGMTSLKYVHDLLTALEIKGYISTLPQVIAKFGLLFSLTLEGKGLVEEKLPTEPTDPNDIMESARRKVMAGEAREDVLKQISEVAKPLGEMADRIAQSKDDKSKSRQPSVPQTPPLKNKVFISYAHDDKKWLDRLLIMMRPILRNGMVEVWHDGKIKASQKWRDEINKALDSSSVALLLVSKHFLNSDFIDKSELPYLLKAAKDRNVTILWVMIGHCIYEHTELKEIQAVTGVNRPWNNLRGAGLDAELKKVCEVVRDATATV